MTSWMWRFIVDWLSKSLFLSRQYKMKIQGTASTIVI